MHSGFSVRAFTLAAGIALVSIVGIARAQPAMPGAGQPSGMPSARMMSGIPMPMGDLPDGTVSVRVVRDEVSNVLPGQQVELLVDGASRTAKTDDDGRGQFSGVVSGSNVKAVVTVDGERIESQAFTMPEKGGVRLLLAASGIGASARPGVPAVAGTVVFGGESRIVIEFDDDTMSVFYLLDVVNNGTAPVNPARPLAFDLPPDAADATVLQGSSPQVSVKGTRVSLAGPFGPGRTSAQIAFDLTSDSADRTIVQRFPAAIDMVSVAVQKAGAVQMKSAQVPQQQEVPADGKTYIVGNGPSLPAGSPLTIDLTGLPHHETWPRNAALVLAVLILCAGAWAALGGSRHGADARRRDLEARRERLFAESAAAGAGQACRQGGCGGLREVARRVVLRSRTDLRRTGQCGTRRAPRRGRRSTIGRRRLRAPGVTFDFDAGGHSRRVATLRAAPCAVARVARVPRRGDRRPARTERRGQVDAAVDPVDAAHAVVGRGALRQRTAPAKPDRRCAPASACSLTTCTCILS